MVFTNKKKRHYDSNSMIIGNGTEDFKKSKLLGSLWTTKYLWRFVLLMLLVKCQREWEYYDTRNYLNKKGLLTYVAHMCTLTLHIVTISAWGNIYQTIWNIVCVKKSDCTYHIWREAKGNCRTTMGISLHYETYCLKQISDSKIHA